MEERTLKSPGPGTSIKRDHSPYCESKGPIIQEGFVAQRIRALQELQAHALAGNRSHSPMLPCPPRSVRSYEPLSPPRSLLVPRPAVKVPAMSEYGAIKHHWASMAGGTQGNLVEGASSSVDSHIQARSTQRASQSAEWDERHSVTAKAIEGIEPSAKTVTSSEQFERYQPYVGSTKTTQGTDMTHDESRAIEPEELNAVPTHITERVIEHSADSQGGMQGELHTTPTKTTRGKESTTIVPHNWQELDPGEPRNSPTRSTQSVASTSETPASSQGAMLDEAYATMKRSSQSSSAAVSERASSEMTKPNESHRPMSPISRQRYDEYTPKPSEPEVLGPNPVPANLADPSVLSRCISPREARDDASDHYPNHEQTSRIPPKSVADKLGSLVERGWVGCDVFGRAYNQNADSEGVSTTSHTYGNRADPGCVSSGQKAPYCKPAPYHVHSSGSSTNGSSESHRSFEHDTPYLDRTTPRPLLGLSTSQPRDLMRREMRRGPETFPFDRRSSRVGFRSIKTSLSSPTSKRRVFSLQHLYRLRRSNSEGIELRNVSRDSTATSKHDSVSARLPSQERGSSESNPKDIVPGHGQELMFSASAPIATRPRRSSVSRNEYVRSGSRSTSWFKRSWLKTLLGDGNSMPEEDAPHDHAASTSASLSSNSARQDLPSRSRQQLPRNPRPAHMLTKSDQRGESENATTSTTSELVAKEQKSQNTGAVITSTDDNGIPLERRGQQVTQLVRTLSRSPLVSPFQAVNHESNVEMLKQYSHKHAGNTSGGFETSTTSLPVPLPLRRSSERGGTASKSASLGSENSETSLHSPQGTSLLMSQTPRKLSPTSSTSVSVRIHRMSRLSPVPLNLASGRPRAESAARQRQHQVPEEESVHRGLGRGKALKKIQVIISFDGAEDLVIEATGEVTR